jgi:hypothetical protein
MNNTKQACLNLSVLKAGGQPHILFFGIGPVIDNLHCSLAVYGPVQFVLHCGKKALGGLSRHVVIDGGCIDVGDLLVELAFTQANFPNALQLLFKILVGKDGTTAFQAFVIHGVALDGELLNDSSRPLAELHCTFGVYLVTDGNDCCKTVVFCVVAFSVGG